MATGSVRRAAEVEYPESDGKPMAETDRHRKLMIDVIDRLTAWYADDPTVYVTGNLFVYYVEGNPRQALAPDCFVAFGVGNHDRDTYKTWEEGRFPSVVIELTSRTTMRDDLETKFATYQDVWRVSEYFLFDPFDEYLDPPLLGYRRRGDELKPIRPTKAGLTSKTMGITFRREGPRLILSDAATGEVLPTKDEQIARLKAELDALRKRKS